MLKARQVLILLGAFLVGALSFGSVNASAGTLAEKAGPRLRGLLERPQILESKTLSMQSRSGETWVDVLVQGDIDRPLLEAYGAEARTVRTNIATASLPLSKIADLAGSDRITRVTLARQLKPLLDGNVAATHVEEVWGGSAPNFPQSGYTGKDVLLGIIDFGVDYTHEDFKLNNGQSRILNLWDHTGVTSPPAYPAGFSYGIEWTQSQMTNGQCTQTDVDGHGTYIAGTAASNGRATGNGESAYRYMGMAPEADLVVVKLNWLSDDRLIDAVSYLTQKADALNREIVIVIAAGKQSGPHDGTDPLDIAMDGFAGSNKIIVAAAGNEGTTEIHGERMLGKNQSGVISFNVPTHFVLPGEYIDLEAWFDRQDNFSIKLRSPNGQVIGPLTRGGVASQTVGATAVFMAFSDPASGPVDLWIHLSSASSSPIDAGEWLITVTSIGTPSGPIDVWVADQKFPGTTPVTIAQGQTPAKSIASPATATQVIAVGSYTVRNTWTNQSGQPMTFLDALVDQVANFSSLGPRRDGVVKPDIVASGYGVISAKSANSYVFSSFMADDGEHYMASGTSASAAITAGAVALLLEESNQGLTPSAVKAILNQRAKVDGNTGSVPNATYGYGKLSMVESSTTGVGDFVDGSGFTPLSLGAAYPNPLRAGLARVPISLEVDAPVRVAVYDVQGKEVRVLRSGLLPAGDHLVSWDGLDAASREVPAGRYFLRASDGVNETSTSILVVN